MHKGAQQVFGKRNKLISEMHLIMCEYGWYLYPELKITGGHRLFTVHLANLTGHNVLCSVNLSLQKGGGHLHLLKNLSCCLFAISS